MICQLSLKVIKSLGVRSCNGGVVDCKCHRCIEENDIRCDGCSGLRLDRVLAVACPICEGRHCLHVMDHRAECARVS